MTEDAKYWLDFSVRAVSAVGTLMAVLVALFGDRIRAFLIPPKLRLELVSAIGNKTQVTMTSDTGTREELGRYYHVRLTNDARWPRATQAQIFLVRLEEPGPDGVPQVRWSGEIPLQWQWAQIHEQQRIVGRPAVADLCRVIRGKWLDVMTLVYPSDLEKYRLRREGKPVDMTLVLQARSTEGDSPIVSYRVTWDGQWEDGDAEMARHLIIRLVEPPAPPWS